VSGHAVLSAAPGFDAALDGRPSRLRRSDGVEVELAVARWRDPASDGDAWLLDRCTGAVIDLGCGPGRLVAALRDRGIPALGVDVSAAAERLCHRRGVPMVRRNLFARLPFEGGWDHVLLADGNTGIGGDPKRLLRRAAALLVPGGTVLVETDPDPALWWRGGVQLCTDRGLGTTLPWACAGADALTRVARRAGLRRTGGLTGPRSFVEFRHG
jgi:SAM-dependent methyltransferase